MNDSSGFFGSRSSRSRCSCRSVRTGSGVTVHSPGTGSLFPRNHETARSVSNHDSLENRENRACPPLLAVNGYGSGRRPIGSNVLIAIVISFAMVVDSPIFGQDLKSTAP